MERVCFCDLVIKQLIISPFFHPDFLSRTQVLSKALEKYLNGIALETKLSDFLNVEAVKGLLSFTEFEEDIYDKDDDEMKEIKTERQKNRQTIA